jgi:hypothetical protein
MRGGVYKSALAGIACVLLSMAFLLERELNHEREVLGLTRYTELKGAPPLLAMTTVALGGFRGLISNALWMRMNDLQDQDKYFEMVQLADWITKLEPHFPQVWVHQAWNMAYNISVKFKDPADRWRWVQAGIELLRDQGLKWNPTDVLIHRELAWFFQHKMGANLDDAQYYYKLMWAREMNEVLGPGRPDWQALINPVTPDEIRRANVLRDKFKMDPGLMKELDERYGPLEWRLPEAHAIYWAAEGLKRADENARMVNSDDLIQLRRVIYQSMLLSFSRGRMIGNPAMRNTGNFELAPNLAIIPNVSAAYERAMAEDPNNRDHIETAHRNFLREAVYMLYTYNQLTDAANWYRFLCRNYPDKPLLDTSDKLPKDMSLEEYALGRLQEEIGDITQDQVRGVLEGLETRAFENLAADDQDAYVGYDGLARKVLLKYETKFDFPNTNTNRVHVDSLPIVRNRVLNHLLDSNGNGLPPILADHLRTVLGMPAVTNAPVGDASTNAPETVVPTGPAGNSDQQQ